MPAPPEAFGVVVTDVYPGIAPEKFKNVHQGKVVFITGGSRGLGLAAAKAFSQSGAKIFLTGRSTTSLEAAKAEIEASGREADFAPMDVTEKKSVQAAVDAAVKRFGKIDIVVANVSRAVQIAPEGSNSFGLKLADSDPDDWWACVETNVKGCFLTVHATLPHLTASKGYIILVSSRAAQLRFPGSSAYNMAKHATNRLAEWIDIEYRDQGVKSFAVHPGSVPTDLNEVFRSRVELHGMNHTSALGAWTYVRLTSGSEDWLSGRFIEAPASLDEITKLKEKIIEQDALKNRLTLPH